MTVAVAVTLAAAAGWRSSGPPLSARGSTALAAVLLVVVPAACVGWGCRRSLRGLRADVAFHRQLLDGLPVGVTALDEAGGLVVMNRIARWHAGLPLDGDTSTGSLRAADAVDARATDEPARRLAPEELPLRRALLGHSTDRLLIVQAVGAGGEEERTHRLHVHGRPVRDGTGRSIGAVAVQYDLTGLHEAHEELVRQHENTRAIAGAVRAVLIGQEGPAAIAAAAMTITSASAVLLFQPVGKANLVCAAGPTEAVIGLRLPISGGSPVTDCFTTGRPVWVDGTSADPRQAAATIGLAEIDPTLALSSAACYPILLGERCLGVLAIGCAEGVASPRTHETCLDLLTTEIAVALSHHDVLLELERLSGADPLTGTANRRSWQARIGCELDRASRDHLPLSVLMIDLDHFKLYNDVHGHHAGDDLLVIITRQWHQRLRPSDLLCRWGGEEFAVLLPNCALEGALRVAEDLRTSMPAGITCSIGVAEWDHRENHHALVERADQHLYDAKAAGRNRTHLHLTRT